MDAPRLAAAFEQSPWRGDRYFLAALAQKATGLLR